jgi:hypothetical protein
MKSTEDGVGWMGETSTTGVLSICCSVDMMVNFLPLVTYNNLGTWIINKSIFFVMYIVHLVLEQSYLINRAVVCSLPERIFL